MSAAAASPSDGARSWLARAGRAALVLVPFLLAGSAAFCGTLVLGFASALDPPVIPRPFDPELWSHPDWQTSASVETRWHSIRQRMVDDLLERHLPIGLPRSDVLALLGPPDEDARFRADAGTWVYWLGAERGAFAIDSEWLLLSFDDRDRLVDPRLATD